MARIRSVHPGLFTDEAWVSCSPLARLLVIGLWTDADDQGVFEWKPLQIKMRLLPGDLAETAPLLAELEAANLVRRFSADGKDYGAIRNFRRFQRPKKPNSIHPTTEEVRTYVRLSDDSSEPVPHQFPTLGENSPQMEDGGEEETSQDEVFSPSSLHSVTKEVAVSSTRARRPGKAVPRLVPGRAS